LRAFFLLVPARDGFLGAFEHALALAVAPVVAAQLGEPCGFRLREIEPVDGLGEAEVRVDARDDDAGVDPDRSSAR
jgi:hypothetical protein